MLDDGEIDALISADVPRCVLDGSPRVGRLLEDYPAVERDYFRRTGIFPIMHTVVMPRPPVDRHPGLARTVYQAFCDPKRVAVDGYRHGLIFNNMATMAPWFSHLLADDVGLLGEDWWSYGMAANRKAIAPFLRYHHDQGLSGRPLTCEDLFVPDLIGT